MAMLQIECSDCLNTNTLRGYVIKEDLIGTKYENLIDTVTDHELHNLEEKGLIESPWDKWDGKCPDCGSKNVISY